MAMWQLYARQANSIAVRTTAAKLTKALEAERRTVHIGAVKYIDYSKDSIDGWNLFDPYLHKRVAFAHEAEVRLIIWAVEQGNTGLRDKPALRSGKRQGYPIAVKTNDLLERVVVAPEADPWFIDVVRRLVTQAGLPASLVRKSDLAAVPPTDNV